MVKGFLAAYGSGDVSWFLRDELRGHVRLRAANSALGERRYDVHFLAEQGRPCKDVVRTDGRDRAVRRIFIVTTARAVAALTSRAVDPEEVAYMTAGSVEVVSDLGLQPA
jgi:hypothetical protein